MTIYDFLDHIIAEYGHILFIVLVHASIFFIIAMRVYFDRRESKAPRIQPIVVIHLHATAQAVPPRLRPESPEGIRPNPARSHRTVDIG